MDIQFLEPGEAPLPPDEVAFREFEVTPLADGRRVRLNMRITPFQQRPTIEIEILDPTQRQVALSSVVEATEVRMSLTMHLRRQATSGRYAAKARLFYPPGEPVDRARADFSFPSAIVRSTE